MDTFALKTLEEFSRFGDRICELEGGLAHSGALLAASIDVAQQPFEVASFGKGQGNGMIRRWTQVTMNRGITIGVNGSIGNHLGKKVNRHAARTGKG